MIRPYWQLPLGCNLRNGRTMHNTRLRTLLALGLLLLACLASAQGFVIDRWSETIDIRPDATYTVEERIAVTFTEARHGLLRNIPIANDNGKGSVRKIFLSDLSVSDGNGTLYNFAQKWEDDELRLKIGDADVTLDPGTKKTYVIRYKVENGLNWFEQSDWSPSAELYWNVTGNDWEVPIGAADVTISFPESPGAKGVRVRAFSGPYGSTVSHTVTKIAQKDPDEETATLIWLTPNQARVARVKPLEPHEGITVVLSVPETLIPKPPPMKQAMYFLLPNLGFAMPILILPFMAIMWFLFGRDPSSGPMVVQFEPPDGMSGSAVGAMIDEKVDQRDIAAGIITLATKGYLRIHPKEEGLIFKSRTADLEIMRNDAGTDLSPFEEELLRRLRTAGNLVTDLDLRTYVAPYLPKLKSSLYQELVDRGYYLQSPETARTLWVVLGVLIIFGLGFLFTVISPVKSPLPSVVGGIISFVFVLMFAQGMPKPTSQGAKTLAKVRGFQEFIRRARGNELEWMSQKHPDEALFEAYLPHAVAFGLTREWANAFMGILHAMPSWYVTPYGTGFDANWFAYDLVNVSNSLGTSASTPPRSSGSSGGSSGFSSGGGFSGGGFGGGGGGSW